MPEIDKATRGHLTGCIMAGDAWEQASYTANELADACTCITQLQADCAKVIAERDALKRAVNGLASDVRLATMINETISKLHDSAEDGAERLSTQVATLTAENTVLRDAATDAVAISDAALKACPVEQKMIDGKTKCPICGATADQTCFRAASADYRAIGLIRNALAKAKDAAK